MLFRSFKSFIIFLINRRLLKPALLRLSNYVVRQTAFEQELVQIRALYPSQPQRIFLKEANWGTHPRFLFIIPDFQRASGGHLNIFRFANFLTSKTATVEFLIVGAEKKVKQEKLDEFVRSNYLEPNFSFISIDELAGREYSALFFTSWNTLYEKSRLIFQGQTFYFMQDYESSFYPAGSLSTAAENTYRSSSNLGFICAGDYLRNILLSQGVSKSDIIVFDFAVDADIYFPSDKLASLTCETKTVLFYFRPGTSRRMAAMGLRALEIAAEKLNGLQVQLIGEKVKDFETSIDIRWLGSVPPSKLGDIYRSTDLAFVLSATNCSLLPLEVLACGTPVVINEGPNNSWITDRYSSLHQASNTPHALASKIVEVFSNRDNLSVKLKLESGAVRQNSWAKAYTPVWTWMLEQNDRRSN